jgi:4-hydroxy-tetrahydrodipicolinate reductase
MGRVIARLCVEAGDIQIVGALSRPDDPNQGRDLGELAGVGPLGVFVGADIPAGLLGADVVIDFSLAPAVPALVRAAAAAGVPVVSGTTGIEDVELRSIEAASARIPVLWARNMSVGVQMLTQLVEQAVRALGSAFDVEIAEIHHRAKVDSPSGTAKHLADAVAAVRPDTEQLYARSGMVGARTANEVGVFGLRGGDVIGDHTVYLFGPGERLELTHRATSREVFAHGAIRAARWLVKQPAGRYVFADILKQ